LRLRVTVIGDHHFQHFLSLFYVVTTRLVGGEDHKTDIGLGLLCLMPLSTIFQLYRGSQFYWWRKPGYPEKTDDLL